MGHHVRASVCYDDACVRQIAITAQSELRGRGATPAEPLDTVSPITGGYRFAR